MRFGELEQNTVTAVRVEGRYIESDRIKGVRVRPTKKHNYLLVHVITEEGTQRRSGRGRGETVIYKSSHTLYAQSRRAESSTHEDRRDIKFGGVLNDRRYSHATTSKTQTDTVVK